MNTASTQNNHSLQNNTLIPLQLFATQYGYAALLDAEGNELPITELMIKNACEEAMDTLYSFLPQRPSTGTAAIA